MPIDDDNCMVYNWSYCPDGPLTEEDRLRARPRQRAAARRSDDVPLQGEPLEQLHAGPRRCSGPRRYSGIDGINAQDRALQESMGRIVDRSKEHLGPADKAIIQARKLLRQAVKTVEAGGTRTAPAPATTRCAPARRCCRAAPTGARSWRRRCKRETILQTV